MRILYITQWFEPEPVAKGVVFSAKLRDGGNVVEVMTGFPNYPSGKIYDGYKLKLFRSDIIEDIIVNRIPLYPSHDNSPLRRAANYLSFCMSVTIFGLVRARRFDVIYVYTPPITVALAAVVLGWIWRKPVIVDIQDLWPDSVAASGMMSSGTVQTILGGVCDFVYRRSAGIVVQSTGMKNVLIQRGVSESKLHTIYNWADESQYSLNFSAFPGSLKAGAFNIVYGGNLGNVQGLEIAVKAAKKAAAVAPNIHLTLIGDGTQRERLSQLVDNLNATNISILPPVGKREIHNIFCHSDALLVQLQPEKLFEITIPSKVQAYLSVGKPILAGLRGDAADLIDAAGAGIIVEPGNVDALAEAMVRMSSLSTERLREMGERGRAYYFEKLCIGVGISKTIMVLQRAIAARVRSTA